MPGGMASGELPGSAPGGVATRGRGWLVTSGPPGAPGGPGGVEPGLGIVCSPGRVTVTVGVLGQGRLGAQRDVRVWPSRAAPVTSMTVAAPAGCHRVHCQDHKRVRARPRGPGRPHLAPQRSPSGVPGRLGQERCARYALGQDRCERLSAGQGPTWQPTPEPLLLYRVWVTAAYMMRHWDQALWPLSGLLSSHGALASRHEGGMAVA